MKKSLISIFGSLFLLPALAWSSTVFNENFVGIDGGAAKFTTSVSSVSSGIKLDEDDSTTKVYIGRDFSRELGFEIFYVNFGEANLIGNDGGQFVVDNSKTVNITGGPGFMNIELEAFGINGAFTAEVGTSLGIEIKLGVAFWERTLATKFLDKTFDNDSSGTGLFTSLGFIYDIGSLSLGLHAESYQFSDDVVEQVNRLVLSTQYGFTF